MLYFLLFLCDVIALSGCKLFRWCGVWVVPNRCNNNNNEDVFKYLNVVVIFFFLSFLGCWDCESLCHWRQWWSTWISKPAFRRWCVRGTGCLKMTLMWHIACKILTTYQLAWCVARMRLQAVASTMSKQWTRTWDRGAAFLMFYR